MYIYVGIGTVLRRGVTKVLTTNLIQIERGRIWERAGLLLLLSLQVIY